MERRERDRERTEIDDERDDKGERVAHRRMFVLIQACHKARTIDDSHSVVCVGLFFLFVPSNTAELDASHETSMAPCE